MNDLDCLDSSSVILPTFDIDAVYEKCIEWCKYYLWIRESNKPFYIYAIGLHTAFDQGNRQNQWEITIQLSKVKNHVKIDFCLLKVDYLILNTLRKQPRHRIFPYPTVVRSLYRYLGVHLTDDILRSLYQKDYLDRYIKRFTLNIFIAGCVTAALLLYGIFFSHILWGMFISAIPFVYGLMFIDDIVVLKSLRERLYINY